MHACIFTRSRQQDKAGDMVAVVKLDWVLKVVSSVSANIGIT